MLESANALYGACLMARDGPIGSVNDFYFDDQFWTIRYLIEHEHPLALDFGRGDDPYKADWVSSRRQRTGLLLINPRKPAGLLALTRHALGRLRARFRPEH